MVNTYTNDGGGSSSTKVESWKLGTDGNYTKILEQLEGIDKTNALKNVPADTKEEIDAISSNAEADAKQDILGKGQAKGDFRIRKGKTVQIDGVGVRFSGEYKIVETTHTITPSGYTVDFSIGANKSELASGKEKDSSNSSSNTSTSDDKKVEGQSVEWELGTDGKYKKKVVGKINIGISNGISNVSR